MRAMSTTGYAYAFLSTLTIGFLSSALVLPAIAQVTSDGTTNTIVNQSGNNFNILNGIDKGNNLFHSFSNFSVPTGAWARFDLINTPNITTIFSRVTGGNVSNIDGLIQTLNTNNPVSLFLMNPAGIIFGKNAQLNIGGSFISTTANSIKFADGIEFSAINSQATPLLSINIPLGLQMGSNPASITVQGTGHSLSNPSGLPLVTQNPSPTELRVQPGKTLALVGGNLDLNGATLTAKQGQVELGSVSGTGLVSLIPTAQGYALGYENGQKFGDIQLAERSLLDISGVNAGSVQIRGRHIQFTDGSLVVARNFGNLPGGDIRLQATEAIDLIGTTADTTIRSGVRTEAVGVGASGNISVITPRLILNQGAGLNSITFGAAPSGNIDIEATAIELSGFSPINPINVTNLSTYNFGSGNAGDISVNANSLLVSNGVTLASATFGSGSSGKVTIRTNHTTVMGESPSGLYSNISSLTFATGNAKTLTLDTAKLQILDGGAVAATTFFTGNGGDLSINATESIEISGRSQSNNSSINSSSVRLTPQFRQFFSLPDILTANAGNVSIITPNLTLTDGGTVSVTSQGSGNGGSIKITANTIRLDRIGSIQAQTESGNGGNINLQVGKLLVLRDNSAIAATAGGNGNGGNININAPIIAGLENSDIIANAVQGKGGNINITTQGIIGLKFRSQLTPENDITASSQFGVNGTVDINNIGIDPNSGLVELPANVTDPSQQIATGCAGSEGSSFVATGRGGIPQNPTQQIGSERTWSDIRDISAYRKTGGVTAQIPESPEVLVEATSWHRNELGKIELVADKSPPGVQQPLTCAAVTKIK
ncbi:two-partner secretion domain-containing protein [Nostoc sp. 'Peltigera membranacea cyanobiont' N6]|uniref:two-partner secretion domain-containing protein n=1 Tax=Nostoc sp. 'Peltigera membranacea cyanobiont' N6 TaxID=1261031 RepID=UPI000CF35607|nr:S-layer family protein [Nostoc sp. 'Peltigera membranacea cyanobiont' N6]AVH63821.1 filamentous hemagglutinin family outer membrane protein [Nostoc sp. 'Peltigera membranacea cyanobiont' N6]